MCSGTEKSELISHVLKYFWTICFCMVVYFLTLMRIVDGKFGLDCVELNPVWAVIGIVISVPVG